MLRFTTTHSIPFSTHGFAPASIHSTWGFPFAKRGRRRSRAMLYEPDPFRPKTVLPNHDLGTSAFMCRLSSPTSAALREHGLWFTISFAHFWHLLHTDPFFCSEQQLTFPYSSRVSKVEEAFIPSASELQQPDPFSFDRSFFSPEALQDKVNANPRKSAFCPWFCSALFGWLLRGLSFMMPLEFHCFLKWILW